MWAVDGKLTLSYFFNNTQEAHPGWPRAGGGAIPPHPTTTKPRASAYPTKGIAWEQPAIPPTSYNQSLILIALPQWLLFYYSCHVKGGGGGGGGKYTVLVCSLQLLDALSCCRS